MNIILEKDVPSNLESSSKYSASRFSRTWHPRLIRKFLFSSLTERASSFFWLSSLLDESLSKHDVQMWGDLWRPPILTTEAEKEKFPSPKNKTWLAVVGDMIPSKNIFFTSIHIELDVVVLTLFVILEILCRYNVVLQYIRKKLPISCNSLRQLCSDSNKRSCDGGVLGRCKLLEILDRPTFTDYRWLEMKLNDQHEGHRSLFLSPSSH